MNEAEDVLETVKIRSALAKWDAADEKLLAWTLNTDRPADPLERDTFDVHPSQIRSPPEMLVLLQTEAYQPPNSEGTGSRWKPIIVASRYYTPIPHQRVLRYFVEALRKTYPSTPLNRRPYISAETRMVMLFDVGEKVEIMADNLSFYMSTTNSYDLSLGIHTDAYIRNEAQGWGFFLGLAGRWQGTFKHYWGDDTLKDKMESQITGILEKKEQRIQQIRDFASTAVTPDTFTKVGRALNCQKREKLSWDLAIPQLLPEGVKVETVWVKNAGFTVTTFNAMITAWQMLSLFAAWAETLSEDRKADVAQRLFPVIEKILRDEATPPSTP